MVIEEKQKNGAQLFFTSNIENYIIKGELTDEVSPELVELLHYIEHTTQDMADGCKSERIHKMQKRICSIKSSEEVSVRYMQRWEEMEMEKDTSLHSVQVEWIYLKEKRVKRYYFERKKDVWFLEAINWEKLAHGEGSEEDFLTFYEHFASDSIFQRERLHHPLLFVTADPEDEFQILETTLDIGQWFAFRPPMMKEKLTNVRYGQTETLTSDTKVVEFKGFGNGFSNVMYFERRHGIWKLMKFEDLSD